MTDDRVCGRPNPGAGPGGYVAQSLRLYPHYCRCSRRFTHPDKHYCAICGAEWNRPHIDPEHPSLQGRPWPPTVKGGNE